MTHFKCGGVCLGIALHHFLADGPGAMHMINSWAESCRGVDHISLEPFIDRDLLHSRVPPTPSFPHTREYPPAPLTSSPGSKASHDQISDTPPIEPITELLEISPDLVNRLKASAPGYTTFEALAAHIWRCTCKARRIPADTEANIRIPVNGRARLRPPLPPGFFGNPQFRAMATATVGDLTSNGALSYAAGMIHAGLVRVDDEYMRSAMDYLAMQPDMELLRGRHLTKGANVKVTSWAGMGVQGANFGWGQASFLGRGWVEAEGQAYLVPSLEKNKATYLLSISLQPDHMARFKRLFFQDYLN